MMEVKKMEKVKKDFGHPYEPYQIQDEMMDAVYDCIEKGQVGIFESPTGTGKSLSLICSSLTWLRDTQDGFLEENIDAENDDGEPEWVLKHTRDERRKAVFEKKRDVEDRLRRIRIEELRQKQRHGNREGQSKKFKVGKQMPPLENDAEARYALDEYNSDDEAVPAKTIAGALNQEGLSASSMALMHKLGMLPHSTSEADDIQLVDETKVFYCSRTHSQLVQFVREIRRVKLRPSPWLDDIDAAAGTNEHSCVKHLSLASRKNLCIHPQVSTLGSPVAINERCLELQQQGTPEEQKCSFLPNKNNVDLVNDFRDHALAKIRDIEDLGALGKKIGICPYYATRATIKPSEIITLPYPLLLQKSAREALEISLKGHVIIIDEAHNLMDAISNIYSINITQSQFRRCKEQLNVYLHKFRTRLKGKNRVYLTQLIRLLDSLSSCLQDIASRCRTGDGIVDVVELMSGKGVDQINLYKLMRYLGESKLARKVDGYITHVEESKATLSSKAPSSSSPVLTHIQSFLQTLTNPASEGRFFFEKDDSSEVCLKYMLLDPTQHFRDIVEESKAVILAGGTMSPMDDYVRHLFAYVDPNRLRLWSCGHIIPSENLIVWPVVKGPKSIEFDFTYKNRNSTIVINALGHTVLELSTTIPDGMVIFFPSYAYLDQVVLQWQKAEPSLSGSIWDTLSSKKPLYRESKDTAGVEDLLQEYTKAIDTGKGGILLSVIGGKMSEGINFSDRLGRCVVVVGLPFPNIQSAQWKAKLEYIEKRTMDGGGSRDEGKAAGREFYENACMRAVNQSIGRAIRHRNDFASIVLLDRRYRSPRIADKLPGWIRQGIVEQKGTAEFTDVVESLANFFRAKSSP